MEKLGVDLLRRVDYWVEEGCVSKVAIPTCDASYPSRSIDKVIASRP
jgi:hypothetical protein